MLKHGSKLSFGGKARLKLIHLTREQANQRLLTTVLTIVIVVGLLAAAAWFLLSYVGMI